MIIKNCKYRCAEEYFALMKKVEQEFNIDILEKLNTDYISARSFFDILFSTNKIDKLYYEYIEKSLGTYFVGTKDNSTPLDCKILESIIYKREKIHGMLEEDFHEFMLYLISLYFEKEGSGKDSLACIFDNLKEEKDKYKEKNLYYIYDYIEVKNIDTKLLDKKLVYLDKNFITDKLEDLEAFAKEKEQKEIIKYLKEYLN